jgi:hypothetical protein
MEQFTYRVAAVPPTDSVSKTYVFTRDDAVGGFGGLAMDVIRHFTSNTGVRAARIYMAPALAAAITAEIGGERALREGHVKRIYGCDVVEVDEPSTGARPLEGGNHAT